MNKRLFFTIVVMAAMLALVAVMAFDLFPLIKAVIANIDDESKMVGYIDAYGMKGVPILAGLQALGVIVTFIPSGAIQLLCGLCYGAWWGALISVSGSIAGNAIIFVSLRQLRPFFGSFIKKLSEHKGLISVEKISHMRQPALIAFLFFLIPGIPNGILPYVFALSELPLSKYLLAVAAGSLPSTLLCTFLGDHLSKGNYTVAVVLALIAAAAVIAVLLSKDKLLEKIGRAGGENSRAA